MEFQSEIILLHRVNMVFHFEIVLSHSANIGFQSEIALSHSANIEFHFEIILLYSVEIIFQSEIMLSHSAEIGFQTEIILLHSVEMEFRKNTASFFIGKHRLAPEMPCCLNGNHLPATAGHHSDAQSAILRPEPHAAAPKRLSAEKKQSKLVVRC